MCCRIAPISPCHESLTQINMTGAGREKMYLFTARCLKVFICKTLTILLLELMTAKMSVQGITKIGNATLRKKNSTKQAQFFIEILTLLRVH